MPPPTRFILSLYLSISIPIHSTFVTASLNISLSKQVFDALIRQMRVYAISFIFWVIFRILCFSTAKMLSHNDWTKAFSLFLFLSHSSSISTSPCLPQSKLKKFLCVFLSEFCTFCVYVLVSHHIRQRFTVCAYASNVSLYFG